MSPREQFERELNELRAAVGRMGVIVENQLEQALHAFETLDPSLGEQVIAIDQEVNARRFSIEETCFRLIVTQQPAARDLRAIIAALNIIVDLERIGDKAKDIANTIAPILEKPNRPRPSELSLMGNLVRAMLHQCLHAYTQSSTELAKQVAGQTKELDSLFARVVNQMIEDFAKVKKEKKVTAAFGILRAAQHVDRIGDLATNVAERIIYIDTGNVQELKVHSHDTID